MFGEHVFVIYRFERFDFIECIDQSLVTSGAVSVIDWFLSEIVFDT